MFKVNQRYKISLENDPDLKLEIVLKNILFLKVIFTCFLRFKAFLCNYSFLRIERYRFRMA
jgi:hypothetical protein